MSSRKRVDTILASIKAGKKLKIDRAKRHENDVLIVLAVVDLFTSTSSLTTAEAVRCIVFAI